ncbi:FtsX-like permease family protein [Salsipaludibacter albus]|uniref:FtsX-like permease family protein n=1 Tax=Salsipaludibacter albus TaxID=2849650 RepID=UPI001EE4820E|nr:FtsX-like permease family protein [Salsipaludibacter albus]MBY5162222.1 hypothetical protein [Salsipaludibacter albus]
MSIAIRELRRRFGQFLPVLVAMTLLVVLLVVLGAFLDGLSRSQTGVLRAQGDRVLVLSDDADLAPSRSRLPDGTVEALAQVDGVEEVGRLSTVATTASVDGDVQDVVLVGYDLATDTLPEPPTSGEAVVDAKLADLVDVEEGDTLAVGPDARELTVTTFVGDVSAGSPTIWVAADDWLELADTVNPTERATTQAAVVSGDATPDELAGTGDGLAAATVDDVIAADDVVTQQSSTFQGIIGVTFVVTLLVVALFFVLLTIERVRLYAVLKAIGARTRDLVAGLAAQAVAVAALAVVLGIGLGIGLTLLVPPDLPLVIVPARLAVLAVATVVVAVLGALGTLRRILRIDPADAIG